MIAAYVYFAGFLVTLALMLVPPTRGLRKERDKAIKGTWDDATFFSLASISVFWFVAWSIVLYRCVVHLQSGENK